MNDGEYVPNASLIDVCSLMPSRKVRRVPAGLPCKARHRITIEASLVKETRLVKAQRSHRSTWQALAPRTDHRPGGSDRRCRSFMRKIVEYAIA